MVGSGLDGTDRARFRATTYLPLVARITTGRGVFATAGANAIESRGAPNAALCSRFGYWASKAAGSCVCHCAKAGVAASVEMARAAITNLDFVMVFSPE